MKVFILICLLIVILLCSCLNKNNIIEGLTTNFECTYSPNCNIEIQYCNNGTCEDIVSSDLHPDNFQVEGKPLFHLDDDMKYNYYK